MQKISIFKVETNILFQYRMFLFCLVSYQENWTMIKKKKHTRKMFKFPGIFTNIDLL